VGDVAEVISTARIVEQMMAEALPLLSRAVS
jgi:hypothetical protein